MLENLVKPAIETTTVVSKQVDGVKFMETLKGKSGLGKEFMDSLNPEQNSTGKDFMESLKKDSNQDRSFSPPLREDAPRLTDDDLKRMKQETGWPDSIVSVIDSQEEFEIYKNTGLVPAEINGKDCLIRSDINMEQKDEYGRTNKERIEYGLSPLNKNGKTIELHHIGQKADGPLAELTQEEHRGKGNDRILHDKNKDSEIDRVAFQKEKEQYWEERGKQS
jgi:hypothetical protein